MTNTFDLAAFCRSSEIRLSIVEPSSRGCSITCISKISQR
jgi:hypothetical protein